MKRRIEISVESREVWVIKRPGRQAAIVRCAVCAHESGMLTPWEAARLAGVDLRTVFRWIEANRLHFAELPDGNVLICLASLPLKHDQFPHLSVQDNLRAL